MIRRALALAGAAALTVGAVGLPGPAAADEAGVTQTLPDAAISEIGIQMDTDVNGQQISGTFIEVKNLTSDPVSLENYTVEACTASSGLTDIPEPFDSTDEIPAGETDRFLLANDVYNAVFGLPARDQEFDSAVNGFLEQDHGGLLLTDADTGLFHRVEWGMAHPDCQGFEPASVVPTGDKSLNWSDSEWKLAEPSPENASGDTV